MTRAQNPRATFALLLATLAVAHGIGLVAFGFLARNALRTLMRPGAPRAPEELSAMLATNTMGVGAWLGLLLIIGLVTLWRASRVQQGQTGRLRRVTLGLLATVHASLAFGALMLGLQGLETALAEGSLFAYDPTEIVMALEAPLGDVLVWCARLTAFTGALLVLVAGSCWFLMRRETRHVIWNVVDLALLVGFFYVTLKLPLSPTSGNDESLTLAVVRIAVSVLFLGRLFVRTVPLAFNLLEPIGYRMLVASRHLRAKKSGFLATIGTLSILAVAVSSCMLTTVLSVMGGFRNDLKRKILGNHAHVVIDREYATFEGWDPTLAAAREVEGVFAATPYVSGEVMVTSSSNMASAVFRGIDPETIGSVTDLEQNLTRGRLQYLVEPERLLHLSLEERGSILAPTTIERTDRDNDAPDAPEASEETQEPEGTTEDAAPSAPGEEEGSPRGPPDDLTDMVDDVLGESVLGDNVLGENVGENEGVPAGEANTEDAIAPEPRTGLPGIRDDIEEFLRAPAPAQAASVGRQREILPGVVVGRELARTLRLFVGDEVTIVSPLGELGPTGPIPKSRTYRVAGIFYSGMYEYDMKFMYALLPNAQRFLSTGGAISGIEIKVDDVERAPEIAEAVKSAIGRDELRVQDWQELNKNLFGALELEKLAMFITLGIAILIAGFCVFGTLTLMVQEKSREVGILKAMGTPAKAVVAVFMIEGLAIGILGAAVGLGFGFVMVFLAEHFGIEMNPEVYYIDKLPVNLDPTEFAMVGVAAVVVCLVATIFPAYLASRLRPIDALRYE